MAKTETKKEAKKEKVVVEKDIQNGVTRPGAGTKTGTIWEIADSKSQALGKPAGRKEVLDAAAEVEINPATAATQYGRWRKYNGLAGRGTESEEK